MTLPIRTPPAGALEAELLRLVLDTAAHDLGSLSSALALRADVMTHATPDASATACTAIANELRALGNQLRDLSGPRGSETLAPTRAASLPDWFGLVSRFAQPLLGRGVALRGDVLPLHIGSAAVYDLTYIALAVLHAIRAHPQAEHTDVQITTDLAPDALTISIALCAESRPLALGLVKDSDWTHWAQQRAATARIGMQVDDVRVRLVLARQHAPHTPGPQSRAVPDDGM